MTQPQHEGLNDLYLISRTPFCIVDEAGEEVAAYPKEFAGLYARSFYLALIAALNQSLYPDSVLEYYINRFHHVAVTGLGGGRYFITAPMSTGIAAIDVGSCSVYVREEKREYFAQLAQNIPKKLNFPLPRLVALGRYLMSGDYSQREITVKYLHSEEVVPRCPAFAMEHNTPAARDDFYKIIGDCRKAEPFRKTTVECIRYIYGNLYQRISVGQLSEHFHINRSTLSAYFKSDTGMTVSAFISAAKLQAAKRLLDDRTMDYQQIIDLLGFCNQSYFIKKFREQYGLTPQQYRNRPR